jgi:hypothetical protein
MADSRLWLAAALLATPFHLPAQANSPRDALQQSLSKQFDLTMVTTDRTGIMKAGTSLTLQKDNLLLYWGGCQSAPSNTYRNGRISSDTGRNLFRTLPGRMNSGNGSVPDCPQQRFVRGTLLWVTRIDVQKDGIQFKLFCTPDNSAPYYGDLKFPFDKNSTPTLDQALATIAEALTAPAAAEPLTPPARPPALSIPPVNLPGLYVNSQNAADRLQLQSDGSFSLQEGGQPFHGTYAVTGTTLTLRIVELGKDVDIAVNGSTLIVNGEEVWNRQVTAPVTGAGQPLRPHLTGLYVKTQDRNDVLRLNADGTFQLRERGVSVHGTFVVNGTQLVFTAVEWKNGPATAVISNGRIVDNENFVWVLWDQ